MKILNIRDIVGQPPHGRPPTIEEMDRAYQKALKSGVQVHSDGRAYAKFLPAAPLLADGRRGRWENGRAVPRKQKWNGAA